MTDSTTIILVAVIAAVPPTIVALLSLRATKEVHYLINSRMTELLKTTKSEANLQGRQEGREERKEQ